jgi:hypothetical protein
VTSRVETLGPTVAVAVAGADADAGVGVGVGVGAADDSGGAPPDPLPDERAWRALSVLPRKRRDYAEDLHFRECWWDLHELHGAGAPAALYPVALLSFKPDAVVGRRMTPTLDFLVTQGFVPVAVGEARLDRNAMRALWRWNWNRFRVDRLQLCTHHFAATGTLVVLLRWPGPDEGLPATVRLSNLKGGHNPATRPATSLRTAMRSTNRLFTFVHTADEPADIVRELAVFFDRDERRRLLAAATGVEPAGDLRLAERVRRLEAAHPAHDLDARAALARLARRPGGAPGAAALQAALGARSRLDWEQLIALAGPIDLGDPAVLWDLLSVAGELLVMERHEALDLLPTPTAQAWLQAGD